MKILILGSQKEYTLEHIYSKYLGRQCEKVEIYPTKDLFLSQYNASLLSKIYYRVNPNNILSKINNDLIKYVNTTKPDIIWVFKGMEIFPSTLQYFKLKGKFLCNYNPDHPFATHYKGSGNKYVASSLKLYDLHFAYNKEVVYRIENELNINAQWLPFGYDLSTENYNNIIKTDEILKVCFLGNPDKIRADIILFLANNNVKIDLYGHGWGKYIKHPNVTTFNAVYLNVMWETLRKYRVQLNIFRPHNEGSHNMRTFEVPGVGGIMIAPKTPEHDLFFKEGYEYLSFINKNDLRDKILTVLSMEKEKCNTIRENARLKSVEAKYSYKARASFVEEVLLKED